jgi:hypothetical protein
MTTGPRPTPYPIVLQVDQFGTPKGIAESSSIYVSSVSAVTISATNYLGLGGLSGFPGGDLSSLQFKTGNTTFNGSPFLKYSAQLSGLLANAVSASRVLASNLSATTISATTYLNLPGTNLSSLLDVQYASVSGGQALVYSSSINKWAPGYTIYKSDVAPTASLGTNGDIYLQYTQDSTNAAYLSSLLDTNINAVSNGQSLMWNNGYWIPSALPTGTQGAITNIPSASPIWNAASAEGYDIAFGLFLDLPNITPLNPTPFDILGFSFDTPPKITNYRLSAAGPVLGAKVDLSGLKDTGTLLGAPHNSLIVRSTTNPQGGWEATLSPILNSVSSNTISATNWKGLPSAIPIWNANKLQNLSAVFDNVQVLDILAIGAGNIITNVNPTLAATYFAGLAVLSSLADVFYENPLQINDILTYTVDGFWEPSNSISLVNVSATNLRGVNIFGTSASLSNVSATTVVSVSADLSSVKLSKYVEPKSTVTISSSSITLNLNNAQVFEISATSNISSITIQNPDSRSSIVQGFTIIFSADGTQRTVTNWGSIKWSGGTGPTLTSTNNKKDIFSFMSPDNGTNWYGFIGGQNF